MKPVLPKSAGWVLLIALVFLDGFIDMIKWGGLGSPLWKSVANIIGIKMVPLLAPIVLVIFYFAVKVLGWLVGKADKTPRSEELILTILVVVYGVFDIWLIAASFFGFTLITNYRLMIIPLIVVGMIYGLWAQKRLKASEENK